MRASILIVLLLLTACGCNHSQLARNMGLQNATVPDLQTQMVMENIAMFATNKDALPWHTNITGGLVQVADQANGSLAAEVLGNPKTLLPTIGAQRGIVGQWNVVPSTDADDLELLALAYRRAVFPGDLDVQKKICEQICELSVTNNVPLSEGLAWALTERLVPNLYPTHGGGVSNRFFLQYKSLHEFRSRVLEVQLDRLDAATEYMKISRQVPKWFDPAPSNDSPPVLLKNDGDKIETLKGIAAFKDTDPDALKELNDAFAQMKRGAEKFKVHVDAIEELMSQDDKAIREDLKRIDTDLRDKAADFHVLDPERRFALPEEMTGESIFKAITELNDWVVILEREADNFRHRYATAKRDAERPEAPATEAALQRAIVDTEQQVVELTRIYLTKLPFIPKYPTTARAERNVAIVDQTQRKITALAELAGLKDIEIKVEVYDEVLPPGSDRDNRTLARLVTDRQTNVMGFGSDFSTQWVWLGTKKELEKDACRIGQYCDCYSWVYARDLDKLQRFALIILSLSPTEKQDIITGTGPAFTPSLR